MAVIEPLKKNKKSILKNVKLTGEEANLIQENANKYANGNFSEWVRYAAIKLKPKKKDIPAQPFITPCPNCDGSNVATGMDDKGNILLCRVCGAKWKPLIASAK